MYSPQTRHRTGLKMGKRESLQETNWQSLTSSHMISWDVNYEIYIMSHSEKLFASILSVVFVLLIVWHSLVISSQYVTTKNCAGNEIIYISTLRFEFQT